MPLVQSPSHASFHNQPHIGQVLSTLQLTVVLQIVPYPSQPPDDAQSQSSARAIATMTPRT